uniref:hypothetical protein n=1 Tax=Marinobacterium profundum TaxID=1714300 RepID=UPI00082F9819|nr:hypothetical protein [Marinobacterium profundum]
MASVKEKVINQALARIERRLTSIRGVLDANPLSDLCEVREKAAALHDACFAGDKRDHDGFIKGLDPLVKEEARLLRLAKRQLRDSMKLIDKQVELEFERGELIRELSMIDFRNSLRGS